MNKYYLIKQQPNAAMAELADALDLGSSSERSTGSIPASRTKRTKCSDDSVTVFLSKNQ